MVSEGLKYSAQVYFDAFASFLKIESSSPIHCNCMESNQYIIQKYLFLFTHAQKSNKVIRVWNDTRVNEQMMTVFSLLGELFL